jgi:hypothetical protein
MSSTWEGEESPPVWSHSSRPSVPSSAEKVKSPVVDREVFGVRIPLGIDVERGQGTLVGQVPELRPTVAVVGLEVEGSVVDGKSLRPRSTRSRIDVLDLRGRRIPAGVAPQLPPVAAVVGLEVKRPVVNGEPLWVKPTFVDHDSGLISAVVAPEFELGLEVERPVVDGEIVWGRPAGSVLDVVDEYDGGSVVPPEFTAVLVGLRREVERPVVDREVLDLLEPPDSPAVASFRRSRTAPRAPEGPRRTKSRCRSSSRGCTERSPRRRIEGRSVRKTHPSGPWAGPGRSPGTGPSW